MCEHGATSNSRDQPTDGQGRSPTYPPPPLEFASHGDLLPKASFTGVSLTRPTLFYLSRTVSIHRPSFLSRPSDIVVGDPILVYSWWSSDPLAFFARPAFRATLVKTLKNSGFQKRISLLFSLGRAFKNSTNFRRSSVQARHSASTCYAVSSIPSPHVAHQGSSTNLKFANFGLKFPWPDKNWVA